MTGLDLLWTFRLYPLQEENICGTLNLAFLEDRIVWGPASGTFSTISLTGRKYSWHYKFGIFGGQDCLGTSFWDLFAYILYRKKIFVALYIWRVWRTGLLGNQLLGTICLHSLQEENIRGTLNLAFLEDMIVWGPATGTFSPISSTERKYSWHFRFGVFGWQDCWGTSFWVLFAFILYRKKIFVAL